MSSRFEKVFEAPCDRLGSLSSSCVGLISNVKCHSRALLHSHVSLFFAYLRFFLFFSDIDSILISISIVILIWVGFGLVLKTWLVLSCSRFLCFRHYYYSIYIFCLVSIAYILVVIIDV